MEEYKGFWRLTAYSAGIAGWSILMNTIWVMLVFFYLPPKNTGMPVLVPQFVFFGILTAFSLVLASGRLVDAVTDPIIAWLSDRHRSWIIFGKDVGNDLGLRLSPMVGGLITLFAAVWFFRFRE